MIFEYPWNSRYPCIQIYEKSGMCPQPKSCYLSPLRCMTLLTILMLCFPFISKNSYCCFSAQSQQPWTFVQGRLNLGWGGSSPPQKKNILALQLTLYINITLLLDPPPQKFQIILRFCCVLLCNARLSRYDPRGAWNCVLLSYFLLNYASLKKNLL